MTHMETAVPVSVIKIKSYMTELEEWALYEHVKVAIDRDRIRFVLDFSGLTYINSRGIGVVAACVKAARDAGGDLMLCHLTDTIEKLFHISGMHRFIDIVPDESAALALFASR